MADMTRSKEFMDAFDKQESATLAVIEEKMRGYTSDKGELESMKLRTEVLMVQVARLTAFIAIHLRATQDEIDTIHHGA